MPAPRKMPTAPTPTSWMAGLVKPKARSTTPSTASALPMTIRRVDDRSSVAWVSAMAAMGAMRTARRAGLTADTTVTPIPTTRAATTVWAWKTSGP